MNILLKVDYAEIRGARVNLSRGGYANETQGVEISVSLTDFQTKNLIDQLAESFGEATLIAMVKDEWKP